MIIELPPETEASLLAQAEANGLPLPLYVQRLLTGFTIPVRNNLSPAERASAFREWADSHPITPPLSDQAISRDNLYPDRA